MPGKTKRKRVGLMIEGHAAVPRAIALGVCQYCKENSPWDIMIETSTGPIANERLKAFVNCGAHGVIGDFTPELASFLARSGVPTVDIGPLSDTPFPAVYVDFRAVGRMIARHMLERRFLNFAYCANQNLNNQRRLEGFEGELKLAGFHCSCHWLPSDRSACPGALGTACHEWLKALPKPVGLMCNTDMTALETVWACEHIGLGVPQDVAIVGCDNDDLFCGISPVPLSTVMHPSAEIGSKAGNLLAQMMSGGPRPDAHILVQPMQLIVRASSDSYAIADPQVAAALQYIRNHAAEPIQVSDVAKGVSLVRRTLERQFHKLMGRSPRLEILHAHIDRAKLLLTETRLKIPAVAAKAGFKRRQVLSPLFKKATGLTPSEYRQKYWHGP
jgi:LacI family transcriptional regulator